MQRPTSRWLPVLVMPLIALSLEGTGRANPIEYMSEGDIGVMTGAHRQFRAQSHEWLAPGPWDDFAGDIPGAAPSRRGRPDVHEYAVLHQCELLSPGAEPEC